MRAPQREPGRVVIERLYRPPSGLAMTTLALFAKPPLMGIDRFVAIEAGALRFSEFRGGDVASSTRHRSVGIAKRKIGEVVIERLAVELDDIGAPSFMIGMTEGAFARGCVGMTAMKAFSGSAVSRNLLVTIEAKPHLVFS